MATHSFVDTMPESNRFRKEGEQETEPRKLQPLAEYKSPAMPTDETIRRFGWKVWQWWNTKKEDPFIADESLQQADSVLLEALVSSPACGPVMSELTETFSAWADLQCPSNRLQLVVLPPCEENDVLSAWANRSGYRVVAPPPRDEVVDPTHLLASRIESIGLSLASDSNSSTVTVIPRLETWFLRHQDGLRTVLQLFDAIALGRRNCIVGCSSWAWAYLCKSTQAGLVLPSPMTFHAFDGDRLQGWLETLASGVNENGTQRPSVLRFADSGKSVFGKDASAQTTSNFFKTLAARSRGIPWVAWHLWRKSLRTAPREKMDQQKFPEERTVWVSALAEFALPSEEADAALLILHSLLIHESLTLKQIDRTVPTVHRFNVLPGLIKAGYVHREGEHFFCSPAAYPAIRESLSAAGFPLDKI